MPGMMFMEINYGLLSESKCFLESQTLTCVTCHDPHSNASNDLKVYSATCMGCHNNPDHTSLDMDVATTQSIKNNCIDCHMPEQPSNKISFQLAGINGISSYLLRTHKIAVYKNEKVADFLKEFKKLKVSASL